MLLNIKKTLAVLPALFFLSVATAQNLVPNPGFETVNCPTGYNGTPGQVALYVPSWYSANCASPDPMTNCSTYPNTSVPDVWFGSSYGHTGDNFMGIGFYGGWYEYIGCQLTQPLVAGTTYEVSFFVRCAQQAKYASDALGIYFSDTAIICTSGFSGPVLPYTPQVVQTPGSFLSDTSGWVEVSGLYTATGGEEFLVLGCFNTWNTSLLMDIGGSAARCYYFWDDIRVEETGSAPGAPAEINGDVTVCEGSYVTYTVDPVAGATSYTWTLPAGWTGSSDTNSIDVTTGATGGTITVTANNSYGSSAPVSMPVTVVHISDSVMVNHDTLTAFHTPGTYQWMDCTHNFSAIAGETDQVFIPVESGEYAVIVTESGCTDTSGCVSVTIDLPASGLPPDVVELFSVFPNPTHDVIFIETHQIWQPHTTLQLIDLAGKVMLNAVLKDGPVTELDLQAVPAGLYVIRITGGTDIYHRKITVIH